MSYDMTLEHVLRYWPKVKVFSFMFYGQPGARDLEVLQAGVEIFANPVKILAEEIDEEKARALDTQRGWLFKFVFPFGEETHAEDGIDEEWIDFISEGLKQLRAKNEFISVEEVDINV